MKKYFCVQLKRVARFLPWGLCVVLVLFLCMTVVYNAMRADSAAASEAENTRIKIAVVGTANDRYLKLGLAAMQFDSTAMSMQLVAMEEDAAIAALLQGEIGAYFVFPENFLDDAFYGNVHRLRFVSTMGAAGLVSIVKDEILSIADNALVACESGSYGVGDALLANGNPGSYSQHVNDLSVEYVDFLLDRSKMYRIEETATNNIAMDKYMLGGLTVTMLMLSCLPFAPLYIRGDQSLFRVLRARRVGAVRQSVAEFGAYLLAMTLLLAVISAVLYFGEMLPAGVRLGTLFAQCIPMVVMMTGLAYCMFAFSEHLITGVLLSFFVTLALCFIGGCLYPLQFFPVSVQHMAQFLPTGIARQNALACFIGAAPHGTWALVGYGLAFLALATGARAYRAGKVRG